MAPADSRPPGCTGRNWPGGAALSSAPATRHETDIRLCPVPPETIPEPAHSGLANEALAYLQAARPCSAVRGMRPKMDLVRLPRTKAKAARASLLSWGLDPKLAIPLTRANRACCAATRTNPLGSGKRVLMAELSCSPNRPMRVRQCWAAKENQIRMPITDHLIRDMRHAQIPADTDRYANFPP